MTNRSSTKHLNPRNDGSMRNDITGLRALAVLPVLFFHAKIPFFSGGFLGVDLFFVISGYLIIGNIVERVVAGNFSFIGFYDRRARRILPALLLVIIATCAAAPFFMVPYDIKNLGQSAFASSFAVNNILLYLTSGYWSHAAEFKPLYHTWSLGVEEQYYLAIPVLLLIAHAITRFPSAIYLTVGAIFLFSFSHSLLLQNDEYNFLIIFPRAWELMMGGALAVYLIRNRIAPSESLSSIGFVLIFTGFLFPYALFRNQALVNLVPTTGALLIIAFSGQNATLVGRLLSTTPMVWIGLISYSIYLWHQPLIAYFRLASEYEPEPIALAAASMISIPLAYISWRFVENPARNRQIASARIFYPVLVIVFLLTSALGLLMYRTYGFQRWFPEYSYEGNPQNYVDRAYSYMHLSTETDGKPRIVVLGNSFARDFINMMNEDKTLGSHYEILYDPSGCSISAERLRDMLGNAKHIILAYNWAQRGHPSLVYEDLRKCVARLEQSLEGRRLHILGAKNFGWNNNFVKMKPRQSLLTLRTRPIDSVLEFNAMAAKGIRGYIDVISLISDSEMKVPIFADNGKFITYDTNHLTKSGAAWLGSILFEHSTLVELKRDIQ